MAMNVESEIQGFGTFFPEKGLQFHYSIYQSCSQSEKMLFPSFSPFDLRSFSHLLGPDEPNLP